MNIIDEVEDTTAWLLIVWKDHSCPNHNRPICKSSRQIHYQLITERKWPSIEIFQELKNSWHRDMMEWRQCRFMQLPYPIEGFGVKSPILIWMKALSENVMNSISCRTLCATWMNWRRYNTITSNIWSIERGGHS